MDNQPKLYSIPMRITNPTPDEPNATLNPVMDMDEDGRWLLDGEFVQEHHDLMTKDIGNDPYDWLDHFRAQADFFQRYRESKLNK